VSVRRAHAFAGKSLIVTSKGLRMMTVWDDGKMVRSEGGTRPTSVSDAAARRDHRARTDQYAILFGMRLLARTTSRALRPDQIYPSDRAATLMIAGYRIAEWNPETLACREYSSADDERRAAGHSRIAGRRPGPTLYPEQRHRPGSAGGSRRGSTTRLNDVNLNIQPASLSPDTSSLAVDRSHSLNLVRSKLTLHTAAIIRRQTQRRMAV